MLGLASSATSCELELEIVCGDGYVDVEAGEECDPGAPSSFAMGCVGTSRADGLATCDPILCTIVNTLEQCASCGDGNVDEEVGEECDGDNLAGAYCLGNSGVMRCGADCRLDLSGCKRCGNGVLEPELGEECDPNEEGGITSQKSCEGLPATGDDILVGGTYNGCDDQCRFVRTNCTFCGDNNIDGPRPIDGYGNRSVREICDGTAFSDTAISELRTKSICYVDNDNLRPIVTCTDECNGVEDAHLDELCCVKSNSPCPEAGGTLKCCFEYDHPDAIAVCNYDSLWAIGPVCL